MKTESGLSQNQNQVLDRLFFSFVILKILYVKGDLKVYFHGQWAKASAYIET